MLDVTVLKFWNLSRVIESCAPKVYFVIAEKVVKPLLFLTNECLLN